MLSSVQTACQRDSSSLVFCDKILKLPTMILHRSLAEDQHDFQFPEIPFIPRSFSSRSLSPQRSEVCVGAEEVAGGFGVSGCFGGEVGGKVYFFEKKCVLGVDLLCGLV